MSEVTDGNIAVYSFNTLQGESDLYNDQSYYIDAGDFMSASRKTLHINYPENYYYGTDPEATSIRYDYTLNGGLQDMMQNEFYSTYNTVLNNAYYANKNAMLNPFIRAEKERIRKQSEGTEYNRLDSFGIGTVYLTIPPTQISITNEAHHYRFNALRQQGEVTLTSGRSTTRIDLEVIFNSLEDINSKLRPLIAQLKTTPFLPLENEHLTRVLNPFDRQLVDEDLLTNMESNLQTMQERDKLVRDLVESSAKVDTFNVDLRTKVEDLWNKGYLGDTTNQDNISFYTKLVASDRSYLTDPNNIPQEELVEEDYVTDALGVKTVSLSKFLRRHITVGGGRGADLLTPERNLNEIDRVQGEIEKMKTKMADLNIKSIEERYRDRQIVGVLSQITVTTIPNFPSSLSCRMSFYVFNYDPYSIDHAYISGYNNKSATSDITKCDLFIDWYSKRWLSDRNDSQNPSLSTYSGNQDLTFTYATKLNPVDERTTNDQTIQSKNLVIGGKLIVTGIGVSIRNVIQFLPILSCKSPTCQYMGSLNTDVTITFECTDKLALKGLSQMVEKVQSISREANRQTRNNFVLVKNNLLEFFATKYFIINNYTVDTVVGNPGLFSITLSLVEYKIGQEKFQRLKREGVTTQDEVLRAAKWMFEKANLFAINKTANARYETYYNQIADPKKGWLSKGGGMIRSFINNVGGTDDPNEQLRATILSRSPSVSVSNAILRELKGNIPSAVDLFTGPVGITGYLVKEFKKTAGGKSTLGMFNLGGNNLKSKLTRDYIAYESSFISSLNNDNNDSSFFQNNVDLVAQVAVNMRRDEIITRIFNIAENSELNAYLNDEPDRYNKTRSKEDKDAAKEYCYPDLDLPTYADLPNGFSIMNSNKEAGIPHNPQDSGKSIQSGNAQVDPDFFMYRGSLWGSLDDSNLTFNGVHEGIRTYKKLAEGTRFYKKTKSLDEEKIGEYLSSRQTMRKNIPFDTGPDKLDSNTRSKLEGKDLRLDYVYDGDTIHVTDGSNSYSVRLYGYNAPELKDSDTTVAKDKENAQKATDYLSSLIGAPGENKIRLYFGVADKDRNDRILAHVQVEKPNGTLINVNAEMLKRSSDFNLTPYVSPDDPLAYEDESLFYQGYETYIKSIIRAEDKDSYAFKIMGTQQLATGLLTQNVGMLASSIGTFMAPWFGRVGSMFKDSFTTDPKRAGVESMESGAGVISPIARTLYGISEGAGDFVFDSDLPDRGDSLTNDIDGMVAKGLTHVTNNYGAKRFDRDSDHHIDMVAHKIREQQKDNTLRVSRAFPTFKIYFIEEDSPEWGRLDDLYSYQSVANIEVTKSRKDAADVAVVTMFNTTGTLDKSYFGLYSEDGQYYQREASEAIPLKKQETREEQRIEEFVLQPGTIIKIKMGYSSDPDLLDTVFTGMVAEVSGGDMITIVAQGFGVELLHQAPQNKYITESASAFKVLDRLITSPEVRHFGKVTWFPEATATSKTLFRRPIQDPKDPTKLIGASIWRNIGGFRYIMGLADDTRNNNIWAPENSWLYNMSRGGYQHFITKDMTIWDTFRDMMRRMPGYITTVLPFDNRATIYFGPADFMYWYTDQKKDAMRDWNINYFSSINKTREQKLEDLVTSSNFAKVGSDFMNEGLSEAAKSLTDMYSKYPKIRPMIDNAIKSLSESTLEVGQSDGDNGTVSGIDYNGADVQKSVNFFKTTASSELTNSVTDQLIKKKFDFIADQLSAGRSTHNLKASNKNGKISIGYNGVDELYVDPKDGSIYDPYSAVSMYDKTKTQEWQETNPSRKLVRQYHFKDSYHHIVSNTIVASSQYLFNKVTVEFGLESMWKKTFLRDAMSRFYKISSQIDDDIWPEKIKEKVVQEKNARDVITAWNYALGNLWEEARKMYGGHLTILGDASIKPYDYIMMSDYFTEMHGPVEVEQVTHHFSPETGFVTTIVPNLVCYVNNALQKGSVTVAGAYMDSVSDFVSRIRGSVNLGGVVPVLSGVLGNTAGNIAFWMTGLSTGRREPISFSPLMYAGRPFIAGVEGMRKNSIYESIRGRITRMYIQNRRIAEYVTEGWGTVRRKVASSMEGGNKI